MTDVDEKFVCGKMVLCSSDIYLMSLYGVYFDISFDVWTHACGIKESRSELRPRIVLISIFSMNEKCTESCFRSEFIILRWLVPSCLQSFGCCDDGAVMMVL